MTDERRLPDVPSPAGDAETDVTPRTADVRVERPDAEAGTIPANRVGPGGDTRSSTSSRAPDGDRRAESAPTAVADGGVANADADGSLTDLEFTPPATDESADLDPTRQAYRVGVPEGVELETPSYSIRAAMNEIETPAEKTWFHELDEAVIDADRCIQCGTCVAACPSDSIGVGADDLPKLVKMCTGCSLCWDFCPRGGLRYERQWVITGGEDNVSGAGDPITEFSARVDEDWTDGAQDGGVVTAILATLLEEGEIDGALIATECDEEPWKAESYLATSREELIANAGTIYNQTLALGDLDLDRWEHKLPEKPRDELSLAVVGTPCEIEGFRALADFDREYGAQTDGLRAIEYAIALLCTKNFNYYALIGEQLGEKRGIRPDEIGKMDVLGGELMVYDHDGELIVEEDVKNFHDAALKGCDECGDFTGFCADLAVGSVGSSDEYSSVIVRTEQGLKAWELTEPSLDYHDLEDRSAIGKLQAWDKKNAFESLERPFDPEAPRFIEYTEHAERYGTAVNPHEGR
ncbi:Coenzyme F420 hydrogenase/dehydrogenase, beta subunit C-terminal domain [Halovivax gelatinilyticus]|uniref:Coenzyme F420 hydrogenase/dehydrogenase, beta subunit C-terminal domain n=1 Tax=Halovivax gelatinilyticus TaxID=2961597 RepID=UPI0020CA9484|nr:Coenzyme F420 hydrogenase/dehydrogenase, beta subunit C-terminal domain [Halovivax gelatinilyticus]